MGKTAWFRFASPLLCITLRSLLALAVTGGTILGSFGCDVRNGAEEGADSSEDDSGAYTIEEGSVACVPVVFSIGKDFYASGQGGETTSLLFTTQREPHDAHLDGDILRFIGVSEGSASVCLFDAQTGEEHALIDAAYRVIGATADGRIVYVEESAGGPFGLAICDPTGLDRQLLADQVGTVVADREVRTVAYTRVDDAEAIVDSDVGLYVQGIDGGEAVLIHTVKAEFGLEPVAVSEKRVLFMLTDGCTDGFGDLIEHDIASGEMSVVLEDCWFTAADPVCGKAIVEVCPEGGDPTLVQAAMMTRADSGVWTMAAVGGPVVDADITARFAHDGRHVAVLEATLGRADKLRVHDASSGEVLFERSMEQGVAIAMYEPTTDGQGIVYTTQGLAPGSLTDIGWESIVAYSDVTDEEVLLATSHIDRGGDSVEIVDVDLMF